MTPTLESMSPIPIHLLIVPHVLSARAFLHPFHMILVPLDRQFNPVLKHCCRLPTQFAHRFTRIDSIPKVMSFPIRDISDQAFWFTKFRKNNLDNLNVGFLIVTAEIIYLTDSSFFQHGQDAVAVIFDIEPIPDIQTLTINRQRLILRSIVDHQRNQLLGKLIWAVVI